MGTDDRARLRRDRCPTRRGHTALPKGKPPQGTDDRSRSRRDRGSTPAAGTAPFPPGDPPRGPMTGRVHGGMPGSRRAPAVPPPTGPLPRGGPTTGARFGLSTGSQAPAAQSASAATHLPKGMTTGLVGGGSCGKPPGPKSSVGHQVPLELPRRDPHAVVVPLRPLGLHEPLAHVWAKRGLNHLVIPELF